MFLVIYLLVEAVALCIIWLLDKLNLLGGKKPRSAIEFIFIVILWPVYYFIIIRDAIVMYKLRYDRHSEVYSSIFRYW